MTKDTDTDKTAMKSKVDPPPLDFKHKFTYEVSYDHTDMTGKLLPPTVPLDFLTKAPSKEFCDALDYFCQRFYPSVDLKQGTPWHKHKEEKKAREGWLENLKENSWPISWYWKALLSVAHRYKKEAEGKPNINWYVCLSQVRQWNMVVVYSEKKEGEETIRTLLRPPLFGESDHILREDAYFALATEEHQIAIETAWKNIQKEREDELISEDECHVEKWFVIGRHDMVYKINSVKFTDTNKMHIELSPKLELSPFLTYNFKKDGLPVLEKLRRPYGFVEVPIHQSRDDNDSAKIILSSDHMCQALAEASEVWNDNTAESVLLISPPGTGKEILAETLYEFRRFYGEYVSSALVPGASGYNQKLLCFNAKFEPRSEDRKDPSKKHLEEHYEKEKERIKKRQNQKEDLKKEEQRLFEEEKKEENPILKKELLEKAEAIKKEYEKDISPITPFDDYDEKDGLILRSRGGLLFLDEIDKVEKNDRASLLRLLENKEFAFIPGTKIFKMKNSHPLFVFAGSMSRKEMFAKKPSDFWTRISHVVEMKHPLEINDERERLRAYSDYFAFFWQKHFPDFFENSGLKCVMKGEYTNPDEEKSDKFLVDYYSNIYKVLMSNEVVYNLAKIFAEETASGDSMISLGVRHIRSIVSRSVFGLVDFILYDKRSSAPLGRIAREDMFYYEFDKKDWTERLIWLLGKQNLPNYDPSSDDNNRGKNEAIEEYIRKRYQMREKLIYFRQDLKDEIVGIIAEAIRKVCFS